MEHTIDIGRLQRQATAAFFSAALAVLPLDEAKAEWTIDFMAGTAWTYDSDVYLEQPGGTNLKYDSVSWDTKPFDMPPYYAIRATKWLDSNPNWGIAVDFVHAKMYADLDKNLNVSGSRNGSPVNGSERLGDSFSTLEFTDGNNLLTLNAIRRWRLGSAIRPYVGAGAGVAIPHVEVTNSQTDTLEFQLAGPAAQVITGLEFPLGDRFSIKAEYRLTWSDLDADLKGGGSLKTEAWAHNALIGIGVRF
jgi:lipid A oxidase